MRSCPNTYYITVIVDTELDLIIGAGTIVVEQKFIHACGEVSYTYNIPDINRNREKYFFAHLSLFLESYS